jgi:hypothetical protein
MPQSAQDALTALRDLSSVEQMIADARRGIAPQPRPRVNSHVHLPPNFSAFETVDQAVELTAVQRVSVLGVSNYYDYDVYGDFTQLARRRGIFPLFGLEIISLIGRLVRDGTKINDPGNPGKMYICGKGITRFAPMNEPARQLLDLIRRNDSTRMKAVVDRLREIFDRNGIATGLNESAVIDRVVARHRVPRQRVYLQERHAGQAFQEKFFEAVSEADRAAALARLFGTASKAPSDPVVVQNEIRSHLMKSGKPAYIDETFVTFEQAYTLILELGGIPVYPVLADGANPICQFEDPVEKLIENIKSMGVYCAEFIPIRNSPQVLSRYVTAMRKAGIVVTAGTEHNTLELLPIEPTCLKGVPIPEELKEIFWEGACVIAAHEFLTLNGKTGFVDGAGKPAAEFPDTEARIDFFRRLGAAVIARYQAAQRGPSAAAPRTLNKA